MGTAGPGRCVSPGGEKGARGCRDGRCPATRLGRRGAKAGASLEQRESPGAQRRQHGAREPPRPPPPRGLPGRTLVGTTALAEGWEPCFGRGHLLPKDGVSFWNEGGGAKPSFQFPCAVDCYTSRFSVVVGLLCRRSLL